MTCLVFFLVDVVEKLHNQRKMDALRFVIALGLVEKFPHVPFLKAYLKHQRKALEEVSKKGRDKVGSLVCLLLFVWLMLPCQYKLSKH